MVHDVGVCNWKNDATGVATLVEQALDVYHIRVGRILGRTPTFWVDRLVIHAMIRSDANDRAKVVQGT